MNGNAEVSCLTRNNGMRLWAVVMVALLSLPAVATADEREERAIPEGEAVHQTDRPQLEGDEAPQFQASQFVEQRSFESLQRQDEAIVRLREMIDRTPVNDPSRAEFLYNLSEIFWERSRYYDHSAIEQQDECHLYDDQGDEDGARRCRFRMRDMEEEAERLRDESVDLYIEIIRNYPDFEELDTVYFHLGTNLMEVGESDEAISVFRRLLAEFPQTEYTPQVMLYFGDYHFDEGDMFQALESYQQVVKFQDSPIYGYARYKLGWTYFNIENYERAMEEFLNVVDIARAAPEGSTDRSMLRQVRGDIVRTYARIGSPDQAIAFFRDIAPEREDWLRMSETLAVFYGDQAEFQTSTRMYRNLIDVNRESVQVIDYQYEIVRNQTTINAYDEAAIQEIVRMMRLITMADEGHFEDGDTELYERIWARVEESSRNWANTYHREAQRTRNQSLYVMANYLYRHYLETFTESEHRYDMYFFQGELLYQLEAWDEAARAYERVLEIDPNGEYTEDAVLATVLALFEIVETSEERAQISADFDGVPDDVEDLEIPEPEEMDELQQRLMVALGNYIEHVPDGDRMVNVMYVMGRTYYEYNHLEESAEIFEMLAFRHSEFFTGEPEDDERTVELAVIAANHHLSALTKLQDFHRLNETVARYLDDAPINDREFQDDLFTLYEAIRYNLCVILDEEEEWEEAALCYVAYVQDFPDSEQVDMALYNAALDFERLHEVGRAIQVRLLLLRMRPNSEYAPETLFNVGGNYHALAVYGEASDYYEAFVRNFPDHEKTEDALSNAATFRQGLGQYDKAIANYERYLELFGANNPAEAAEVFFEIGQIYEEENRTREARDQYQAYLNRYASDGTNDRLLEAHAKIGMYQWENGQRQDALDTFAEILRIYERIDEEERQEMTGGRDAAAQAQFMISEDVFEDAEAIKVDSADEEEMQEQLREKMEYLVKAQGSYEKVIEFVRPDWAIAALYRIGRGAQDFAETVRNTHVPDRLTADQQSIYRDILEDHASEFEAVAVDMYIMALDAARDASWFNDYSRMAEGHLAELRPRDYRRPSEMRAQPSFFRDGFMRSAFILEVEEDSILEDLEGEEEGAPDDVDVDSQAAGESGEDSPSS